MWRSPLETVKVALKIRRTVLKTRILLAIILDCNEICKGNANNQTGNKPNQESHVMPAS